MTKDLPDFQSEIVSAAVEATSFRNGLDANKPASPAAGDIWLATDTDKLYVCITAGAWTGFDASILVQGILTLYANLVGGGYRLTGIADPTSAQDAATKAYVDTVDAKLNDVSQAQPARAIDTIYQNTGGKIRLVTVTIYCDQADAGIAEVGSTSPPGTGVGLVMNNTGSGGIYAPVTFIVLPNYYYRIRSQAATPSISYWTEWDLL